MANTFFDFETAIKNGEHSPPDDEECFENEEEYDALNDETFGATDVCSLDDWEQQHEQFAEIAEINKQSEQIENSISQLVLDDSDEGEPEPVNLSKSGVWAYNPPNKEEDVFVTMEMLQGGPLPYSLTEAIKGFSYDKVFKSPRPGARSEMKETPPRKICTVEELEKNLIKSSKNNGQQHPQKPPQQPLLQRPLLPPPGHPGHPQFHPAMQHSNARLPPPGYVPMGIPPPGIRPIMPQMNPMMPPRMVRMMPPQFMPPNGPPRPPGLMLPHNNSNPHEYLRYIGVPPNLDVSDFAAKVRYCKPRVQQRPMSRPQQSMQHQRTRQDSGQYRAREEPRDEYASLMTLRDKQWLLNIQMLQLNTGTPYFDDYYFTIFKERKLKNNKENIGIPNDRNARFPNNRQRRNSERQENNTLTPRVYTPLQFENSLGKLQCGSVTAPRKIIDMDIVTPEKDSDSPSASRDTRKTKQLLLELEVLYSFLLKAEDINNPMFTSNMEKLRELKQKQRLRELEQATTSEQKLEVLRLFKLESEPVVENHQEYIMKIVNGLLQDDKFSSFLNIRKGKMLLLRTLSHLTPDVYSSHLLEIWSKVLLSLPIVGRRDTAGDNILPKLLPYFKRYIQTCTMTDILDIVAGLVEVFRQENNRSTPLSHVGKAPLYFVLLNKFGVSALVVMFIRSEYLMSTDNATEKQQNVWSKFLQSWALQTEAVSKIATPIDLIPVQIFNKHCNRFEELKRAKRVLLEKYFVEVENINNNN